MRPVRSVMWSLGSFLCLSCTGEIEDQRDDLGGVADEAALGGAVEAELQPTPCANCGEPLAGLDEALLAAFDLGLDDFQDAEEVDDGIGPVFNDVSCVACHDTPAAGGSGDTLETRFGTTNADGSFDPMASLGGSLRQDHGVGELGLCDLAAEATPEGATIEAGRRTTPLFGLGLVNEVPDVILLLIAATQSESIRGTPHWVVDIATGDLRIGRFGWKAQVATLHTFSGDAYLNEMGITSPDFPTENCPQGNCDRLADCDLAADPEDDGASIDNFTNFMGLLAAPARSPESARARRGRRIFGELGCNGCHVSTLITGASDVPQLDHVVFHPFSDFLLHDMGTLGDGITQGGATGQLMRTSPLWGVAAQALFLHDGRATTLDGAIRAHAGQAQAARDGYVARPSEDRRAVRAYLETL